MHVSQSTISEQVAQLEDYLEETLIERNTRSLVVTDRGTALWRYADEIFAKSATINHLFRDKQDTTTPASIRIGMVGGISRNFVTGLVLRSLIEERGTRISLVDGSFDELNALLKSFEIDLIFSLEKPRSKDLLTVAYRKVETSSLCAAGKPELVRRIRRQRTKPLPVELFMFRHSFDRESFERTLAGRFNLEVDVPIATDDISLLRFLANTGRGLAVVPEIGVQEDLTAGHLSSIRLVDAPEVEFFAVYLSNGYQRELIDDFLT